MGIEASHTIFLISTLLWMFITLKKHVEVVFFQQIKSWLLHKWINKVISFCDTVLIQGNLHGWRGNLFVKGNKIAHVSVCAWDDNINLVCPRLNHICVRLGPILPTPLSLPGLLARPCVGTLENDESDVNLNICNFDRVLSHWFPMRRSSHAGAGRKTGHRKRRGKGGAQPSINVI